MKKVKIMVLSLCVFAVVGGALAFKAKTGGLRLCTAIPKAFGPAYCDKACPAAINLNSHNPDVFLCTTIANIDGDECKDGGVNKTCDATSAQYGLD